MSLNNPSVLLRNPPPFAQGRHYAKLHSNQYLSRIFLQNIVPKCALQVNSRARKQWFGFFIIGANNRIWSADAVTKFDLPPLCKGRCLVNTRRRDCIQFVRQSPIGVKVPALPFVCCGLIGLMVKCGQSGTPVPTIVTYYLCRGGICSTNTIQVY